MPSESNFLGPYNDRIQQRPAHHGRRGRSRFSTQPKVKPSKREVPRPTHRTYTVTNADAILFGGYIFSITQVQIPLHVPGEYIYTVHPVGDLTGPFEPYDPRVKVEDILITNVEMQIVQNATTTEREIIGILGRFGLAPFDFED